MPLTTLQDPYEMFDDWFQRARAVEPVDPNAMCLSTVSAGGRPSSRMVLMKEYSHKGIVFYTNFKSRKAREISENPFVSLLFHWKSLERQIRIEGRAEKVPAEQADAYFNSRPLESRIGAWASEQSAPLESREKLLDRMAFYTEKFQSAGCVPRPESWGGYLVRPHYFEFWKNGAYRLHDRAAYTLAEGREWRIARLNP